MERPVTRLNGHAPPVKPCVRISRTRLTDGLLTPHAHLRGNVWFQATDKDRAHSRSDRGASPTSEAPYAAVRLDAPGAGVAGS